MLITMLPQQPVVISQILNLLAVSLYLNVLMGVSFFYLLVDIQGVLL